MRIGLDLDNTLICYDSAFHAAACERGLITAAFRGAKPEIAAHIRAQGSGEAKWQALQGYVYGAGIAAARLFPGATDFLTRARATGAELCIISHKTEFGHFDAGKVNLRHAARNFLQRTGVFAFVPETALHFCDTRTEKVAQIAAQGCEAFVDDLEEVFDDPGFPGGVRKLLFTGGTPPDKVRFSGAAGDWPQLGRIVFDADRSTGTR